MSAAVALHGLAHSLSQFASGHGVTVNVVAPALIATDMMPADAQALDELARRIPVGRLGRSEEVADLIAAIVGNPYLPSMRNLARKQRHLVAVDLPGLANLPLGTAKKLLALLNCKVGKVSKASSSKVAKGNVIKTTPGKGFFAPGKSIAIVQSSGPKPKKHGKKQ